jgi:hypothetical protein
MNKWPKMTRKDYFTQYTYDGTKVNVIEKPGVEIVAFTNYKGKLCTLIWYGKQAKPSKYYAWTSEEKREEYINERLLFVEYLETEKVVKAARKKKAKHPYKVGDVLTGSWGYGQTNVDAFQVLSVKGKTIEIQEICLAHVEGSYEAHGMAGKVVPVKDTIKEHKIYKKIPQVSITNKDQEYWSVKSPIHGSLTLWNGDPLYRSWYH